MGGTQTPRSPTTRGLRDLSPKSEQSRQLPSPRDNGGIGGINLTEPFEAVAEELRAEEPQLAAPPPSQPSPPAGLARRGGVKRISGIQYEETRELAVLLPFLKKLMREAMTNAEGSVTAMDVACARDRLGRTQNGFDG